MCDNGQVYDSCGPPTEPSCDNIYTGHTPAVRHSLAVEGCYCPPGTVRNGTLAHCVYFQFVARNLNLNSLQFFCITWNMKGYEYFLTKTAIRMKLIYVVIVRISVIYF